MTSTAVRAKISGSTTFRHSFASRLAMEGVDLLSIKELGGWKNLAMVQRYAHLSPSHRRAAIERLVTRQTAPKARRRPERSSTGGGNAPPRFRNADVYYPGL